MKHIVTVLFAMLATVAIQAQTYKMIYQDDTLKNGDTIVFQPSRLMVESRTIALPSIYLLKTTDDDVFTDNNITYIQGTGNFQVQEVCGGGNCPQPGSYKLISGQIDALKPLSLHYTYEGNLPAGAYAMHKFTVGTIADSMGHGIGDTVGAPLDALTETTSVYVIVHYGDYHLGIDSPAQTTFTLNPSVVSAGQNVSLGSNLPASAQVNIYSADGRLLRTVAATNGSFSTYGMASGLYLINLVGAGETSTSQKLIVK
ncbi:MAG: T9SS type A sorting domain-containing protein [Bacteroidales bacterium]|nr:T9SS type A sorting domain-containing protein [Bacteroidales bacterium]